MEKARSEFVWLREQDSNLQLTRPERRAPASWAAFSHSPLRAARLVNCHQSAVARTVEPYSHVGLSLGRRRQNRHSTVGRGSSGRLRSVALVPDRHNWLLSFNSE
jgi:hypothetical protein